jgi:hypothetical protein
LTLPFEEFKVSATCLKPTHAFSQSCQMLNVLQSDFEYKPHLLALLQVKKAEQVLTDVLAHLAFLVDFKMPSIK